MAADSLAEKLSQELLRKLQLATEADRKDDRETVCSEVFADIIGAVDENAADELRVPVGTRYFEILALYLDQGPKTADDILHKCRRLWGQPYIVPVYALLLHRWLLMHPTAGGEEQRQKHVNVLVSGARQLFWGDVQSSASHFEALYTFLGTQIVFHKEKQHLDTLPTQSRAAVLSVVACFLPYYKIRQGLCSALENMPVPGHTVTAGGHVPGEGADFVLTEVTETLHQTRAHDSLLKYLSALLSLKDSPYLATTRTVTRLRLQAELYSLTSSMGPRYLPRAVNQAAFDALDALFPYGRRSRRWISMAFRLLHPTEWVYAILDAYRSAVGAFKAWLWFVIGSFLRPINALNPVRFIFRQSNQQYHKQQ